ncbi:MAG: TIGR02444 family protein [Cellvibrionales bacterium]|nr:TIGR02444 family protein [Cellvibrionales bacterium]
MESENAVNHPECNNDLWQYMLAIYQRRGVKAELLALQAQGFNVLILLSLCWLSSTKRDLNSNQLNALISQVDDSLMSEFRSWRNRIKHAPVFHQMYKKALDLELGLEQLAVSQLYGYLITESLDESEHDNLQSLLNRYSELINLPASDKFANLLAAIHY